MVVFETLMKVLSLVSLIVSKIFKTDTFKKKALPKLVYFLCSETFSLVVLDGVTVDYIYP